MKALVCGAGGFIGTHLVRRLKSEGYWVRGAGKSYPKYSETAADDFIIGDLRDPIFCRKAIDMKFDEVYQLAADMGGAGYLFTGERDASVMSNSVTINLNVLNSCIKRNVRKIFFSSSACVYPEEMSTFNYTEDMAYPAYPRSEYGWEKLFSERLYLAYQRNYNIKVHIARFHTIFGEESSWNDGKEKVINAMCRKIILEDKEIEMWGDGEQLRSFLYISECLEGIRRLMVSDFSGPVNIGSDEMVSINQLAKMIMDISGKHLQIKHIDGPIGPCGRNSDNSLVEKKLLWKPTMKLLDGLTATYKWVKKAIYMDMYSVYKLGEEILLRKYGSEIMDRQ